MPRTFLCLLAGALLIATAGALQAATPYPLTVKGAVARLYAPEKVKIIRICKQTLFDRSGDGYYALAWVRRPSGMRSQAAFQFINTAGWFAIWRDGRMLSGVTPDWRARARASVRRLKRECG